MAEAITYLEAIRQGLWEEMERDDRVFCLGEDIGVYGGAFKLTRGFLERFGPDPVIYLEHKYLYRLPRIKEVLPEEDYVVPIGKAAVRRYGKDISLITYGAMLLHCLDAAEILEREGVSAEVLDLRTLLPLDVQAIESTARKTGKVLIVHEDTRTGGIAGEITAILNERAFEFLDGPVLRVTAPDAPVPYSPPLEDYFLPNAARVLEAARRLAAY